MAMKLLKLAMYPVQEVPEQIRRRVGFNASTGALDDLATAVAVGGTKATGSLQYQQALSQIVGFDDTKEGFERPFVNVSDNDDNPIQFQFGSNDTGVYNFVAIIVAQPLAGTRSQETQYVVSGYTSQAEKSLFGKLPDDMVLYINDIYGLQCTYDGDGLGGRRINPDSYRLVDNYVLSKSLSHMGYSENSVDIISVAKSADMVKRIELASDEEFIPDANTMLSPNAQHAPQLLTGQLTRPEAFVSAISNAYLSTAGIDTELGQVDSFFAGNTSIGIDSELSNLGVVRNFNNYELIKAMRSALTNATSDVTGGWKATNKATFRLADLRACISNPLDMDVWIGESIRLAEQRGLGQIEQTDSWIGYKDMSTQGSLVAYDLAMMLGATMTRNLLGEVSFMFDNRNSDILQEPKLQVFPHNVGSLTDGPLPDVMARRFLNDLRAVMVQVTKHNRIRCKMVVTCLVGTVSRIEITIDGDLTEWYTFASFMQFRLHNGNTTDLTYAGRLAKNTAHLLKTVEEGFNAYERDNGISRMKSNLPTGSTGGLGSDLGGLNPNAVLGDSLGGGLGGGLGSDNLTGGLGGGLGGGKRGGL
ncbi:hypothetical protein G173_gp213 [Erwinia phage phiEaH2]|uniref:Uncharacterized protein n=2 Tax=Erskinevirus EaH2 TaxID=2169883 RepID=J7KHN8_9CAUD|nr:hypothetical protein G173_gp213 [Erwinia phage phiEaH2]AFQ96758.1 hypothetical protein [Erwinia phage phiEaH2]